MNHSFHIRFATVDDARQLLNVYAPYVLTTANTFEYDVPTVEEFTGRIQNITAQYPWMVCEHEGRIVGYVYGSTHRYRTAYQWSVESTVYIDTNYHRMGLARIMYNALFAILKLQGYFSAYAGVLVSNTNSVEFHRSFGFEDIGLFKNIGYKLNEWHTNLWQQYFIQPHTNSPANPIAITKLKDTDAVKGILETANRHVVGKAIAS